MTAQESPLDFDLIKLCVRHNRMRHELWTYSSGQRFFLADTVGDSHPALLEPDAQLVWVVYADSAFEAMTKYYEYMDWGQYTTELADIEMQPYSARDDVLGSIALQACRRGDYAVALMYFERAIAANSNSSFAMYGRGLALRRLGQPDAAKDQLEAATTADPHIAEIYRKLKIEV